MKRVFLIVACVSLPLALTGCDVLNYIWQHIIGHSYSQVDFGTLNDNAGNMRNANIGQSSMPVNSVLGYKTRNGFYGKIKVLSVSSSSLTIQFYTYDAAGSSALAESASITVPSPNYCDLETGNEAPALGASDFQWFSGTLEPVGGATFYVFP